MAFERARLGGVGASLLLIAVGGRFPFRAEGGGEWQGPNSQVQVVITVMMLFWKVEVKEGVARGLMSLMGAAALPSLNSGPQHKISRMLQTFMHTAFDWKIAHLLYSCVCTDNSPRNIQSQLLLLHVPGLPLRRQGSLPK